MSRWVFVSIYRLCTGLYFLLIRFYALINHKAKAWVSGRKNWQVKLTEATKIWNDCIWFHCASLGEFEQGRPLIELIKQKHPNQKILLSFFSPSGYLIRKNYELVDYVCYLPADTPSNAQQFLAIIQPKLVVFVKYEWWYFFSKAIFERSIPFYNISCILRNESIFFKPYGILHREILTFYTHLFVQDDASKKLLEHLAINKVTVSGDTRFDRVWQNKQQVKPLPFLKKFKDNKPILIGGSTYSKEDKLLIELIQKLQKNENFKYIIVPHEIDLVYCKELKNALPLPTKLYSEIQTAEDLINCKVLIIDSIGLLNQCYAYAEYALIGGGFNKGIHNILEAVVFGLPVFFGPNYTKAQEAVDLIEKQLVFSIENASQVHQTILNLENNLKLQHQNKKALFKYFKNKVGASETVYQHISMDLTS